MTFTILPQKPPERSHGSRRSALVAAIAVAAVVAGVAIGGHELSGGHHPTALRPSTGQASGLAAMPGQAILPRARSAALAAGTVHLQASGVVFGQRMSETLDAGEDVGQQTLVMGPMTMSARVIGAVTYVKGNAAAVSAQLHISGANAGRWFRLVATDRPYSDVTDGVTIDSVFKDLPLSPPFTVIPQGTVDGHPAVGVRGTASDSGSSGKVTATLWIAPTGEPLPIEFVVSTTTGSMTAHFSAWGKPVRVVAPPNWRRLPASSGIAGDYTTSADAAVKIDLRNLATAEETYLTDHMVYATAAQLRTGLPFRLSARDVITIRVNAGNGYCLAGHNRVGRFWVYSSTEGGLSGPSGSDTCSTTLYPHPGGTLSGSP